MSDDLITAVHGSQVCDGIESKTPHCTCNVYLWTITRRNAERSEDTFG